MFLSYWGNDELATTYQATSRASHEMVTKTPSENRPFETKFWPEMNVWPCVKRDSFKKGMEYRPFILETSPLAGDSSAWKATLDHSWWEWTANSCLKSPEIVHLVATHRSPLLQALESEADASWHGHLASWIAASLPKMGRRSPSLTC